MELGSNGGGTARASEPGSLHQSARHTGVRPELGPCALVQQIPGTGSREMSLLSVEGSSNPNHTSNQCQHNGDKITRLVTEPP